MGDVTKYVPQGTDQLTQLMAAFGGGTKTTQSTTANQAPLMQVLQALQTQNATNPEAILASLMQQFAGKIPQLNAATAAGGARVGGAGAPMTGQMQKLLAQATIAAQQQIAQQQNENLRTQAGVATGIADTSRSSTQVQKSNSGIVGDLMKLRMVNNMIGKATGFDPMEEILRRTKSGLNIGEGFATGDVMDSLSTQMASSLDPFAGFGAAGDLGSLASSLDFGSAATSLDAAINAMNTNVDFGSFSAGDAAAGTVSPASLSGPLDYAPVLSVLNYAANPQAFKDIFELGQGNVPLDLAQLAGGYATASGISSLAGLGSLPYAQLLGPAGIILAGIAGAFVGEESDLETNFNWFKQFLPGTEMQFTPNGYEAVQREGSKSALEIANFLNEYGNVRAQLGDKIPESVQLYLDKLGSGGPLLNSLGDWSSDADRAYAYIVDNKAQTSKWNANRTPDWQRGAPLDRNPYGIEDTSLLDYTPIMDRIRAQESAAPMMQVG